MKWIKKRQRFENYSQSLIIYAENQDISDMTRAISYGWWNVAFRFHEYIIVNNTRYSRTTSKHQATVRAMLRLENHETISISNCTDNLTVENLGEYLDKTIDTLKSLINPDESILRKQPDTILLMVKQIPDYQKELKKYEEFKEYYENNR